MARGLRSKKALMLGCATFCLVGLLLALTSPVTRSAVSKGLGTPATASAVPDASHQGWRPWLAASGIKVSAVVFYGRRKYVRILDKYLKQNLVSSGGLLDEVLWVAYTRDQDDLQWLYDVLIPSGPTFYTSVGFQEGIGYGQHYNKLAPDRYYLKLDDDIMYIRPGSVDAMLHAKLTEQFYIVSANVINHSMLTWVHAALSTMHPHKDSADDITAWSSAKPQPQSYLDKSAFTEMLYRPYEECALYSFECAATCHYSFLDNVARNDTGKYDFGQWDFHAFEYIRWSINTIMFKGSDLNREKIPDDDEEFISKELPKSKGRHCGAVGAAVVVHMAYVSQRELQLEERTGFLEKYERLAESLHGALLPA